MSLEDPLLPDFTGVAVVTNKGAAFCHRRAGDRRVHDGTTAAGANAHVALGPALPRWLTFVVEVETTPMVAMQLTRDVRTGRQANQCITVLLSHQLSHNTSERTSCRRPCPVELDVVDHGTDGDVLKRQSVARLDIGGGASHNLIANLQAVQPECSSWRRLRTQRAMKAGVQVILKGLDRCGNADLLRLKSITRYLVRLPPP